MQRSAARRSRQVWALVLVLVSALLLSLAPLAPSRAGSGKPLRLQLMWLPQAQFAGAYVAQDRDLFAAEGLQVELLAGGLGSFRSSA